MQLAPDIADKIVVITGGSSGLGEAAAVLLTELGARVVLGARRADRLDALAERIGRDRALAVQTDVSDRKSVEALVAASVERFGRVDVLVNNAGVMPLSPLDRLKIGDWERMIDVNVKGVLYGIAAALPHMQRQRSGHIVNVASVAGHKVRPGSTVYSATKHAVRVISEGLRQEVKPYGIRTTIISPGAVATELADSITEPDIAERARQMYGLAIPPNSFARILAFAIGQPSEVDVNEILFRPTAQDY